MADDNALRPSETDEVYIYDQQTAERQQRARTAAANYRKQKNPSDFQPAPSAPSADPDPPSEGDVPPGHSVKVGYYDGLLPSHRGTTSTEVTRFGEELSDYADYYNEHIRKQGDPAYQMPVSQVTPLDVTDDGAERHSESNLVGDYDARASGYSGISSNSTVTTGNHGTAYSQKLASANAKFDKLQSSTDADGIVKKFERLKDRYDEKYGRDDSTQTDRSKMSVVEAGHVDISTIKGDIDEKFRNASLYGGTDSGSAGTSANPAENTVEWFGPTVKNRIGEMVDNIMSKIITISDYNALCADMLNYIKQNRTFSRWSSDRKHLYSAKFSDVMLSSIWTKTYNEYHET